MISEMTGTYAAEDEHKGEYVVIDGKNVIKFDINNIFLK